MTTPTTPLRLRVSIDAPPDTVYTALTDPDTLTDWLTESAEVSLNATPNGTEGQFEFWGRYAPMGDRPRQQLISAEPAKSLVFTWDFDAGEASTVAIALTAVDDGTLVDVEHSGIPAQGAANRTALECFWQVSLANLCAHCEGIATTPPFDFSVPAQGDAMVRTVIDAPTEEVFGSLLDPAQVDKWARGKAVIEPEIGGRYDFGWDHGPTKILELEPDRVLAYSWRYPDSPDTVVRWGLRSSRGTTYLTLVHSGFADDALAEQFRQGWPGFLVELKRIIELGARWEPLKISD